MPAGPRGAFRLCRSRKNAPGLGIRRAWPVRVGDHSSRQGAGAEATKAARPRVAPAMLESSPAEGVAGRIEPCGRKPDETSIARARLLRDEAEAPAKGSSDRERPSSAAYAAAKSAN